ncbi:family 69 putative glycosyltransferase [Podospora australis]|uniref:Family 69 putative glycosyltransferase n=1 Tax=Podospora australis TaxID=1536484 RepID=A0AAN7AI38_9PEZI|nr:family 69 putative glycosyltransferase [Podospora australis]
MKRRASAHRPPRILRTLLSRSALKKLLLLLFVWNILEAHIIYYRIVRTEHEAVQRALATIENRKPTRVFIASLHWNNEKILRSDWNSAVLDLVNTLGADNVFVSVYESGSWDDSKGALRELDAALEKTGVQKKIVLDEATHQDLLAGPPEKEGWITTPKGERTLRRIPYLSKLRNLSLQPLLELAQNGTGFDHVLFLGDVVFTVQDVITLLDTNGGRYAAACSLDFSKPPSFYDTFALRDASGHEHVSQTWPYFRSGKSRQALLRGQAVPVRSCWNGIVSMPASVFTSQEGGIQFRGVEDSLAEKHLEGSECCLIHADNPLSKTRGVFLNANVRVGYSRKAYEGVHPRGGGSWLGLKQIWWGIWKNRAGRWLTSPWLKERMVRGRVRKWVDEGKQGREETRREEKGEFCLINEMQVVVHNGWAHL